MSNLDLVYLFLILFIVLNQLNTYWITKEVFNRYIVSLKHSYKGEINSIIGNTSVLSLILVMVVYLFDHAHTTMLFLIIITFLLNLFLFALNIFNLYYGAAFSKSNLDIFKNPSNGLLTGLLREILGELFYYYRIVLFFPSMILIWFFIKMDRDALMDLQIYQNPTYILIIFFSAIVLIVLSGLYARKDYQKALKIEAVQSTYAIQNYGIYPFYIMNFFGLPKRKKPKSTYYDLDSHKHRLVDAYNKNKPIYVNHFNQCTYSNQLKLKDVSPNIQIHPSIIKNNNDLTGIFEGKKLVLFQVESFNQFLLELDLLKDDFPFIQSLLQESLVFNQFYTSVGLGVSSDAEITTLTGLYTSSVDHIYWQDFDLKSNRYRKIKTLDTLVKSFKNNGYSTIAMHGDQAKFYNRENAYQHIIGFNDFLSLEDFRLDGSQSLYSKLYRYQIQPNISHLSPWMSDIQLADEVRKRINSAPKHTMLFPISMMPHVPFEYNPYIKKRKIEVLEIREITKRYLSFARYFDQFIQRVFFDDQQQPMIDSNTAYLFYGDHGAGIKNGDIQKLITKEKSSIFNRKVDYHIGAFLYVPGQNSIKINGYDLKEGLVKGQQNLVRGHMDIYRSIIELFNLKTESNQYFGCHLFSDEPSFIIDNKLQDVILDQGIYSMRNPDLHHPDSFNVAQKTYDYIKNFKILNDALIE